MKWVSLETTLDYLEGSFAAVDHRQACDLLALGLGTNAIDQFMAEQRERRRAVLRESLLEGLAQFEAMIAGESVAGTC